MRKMDKIILILIGILAMGIIVEHVHQEKENHDFLSIQYQDYDWNTQQDKEIKGITEVVTDMMHL